MSTNDDEGYFSQYLRITYINSVNIKLYLALNTKLGYYINDLLIIIVILFISSVKIIYLKEELNKKRFTDKISSIMKFGDFLSYIEIV